jgi:hypothetical protein
MKIGLNIFDRELMINQGNLSVIVRVIGIFRNEKRKRLNYNKKTKYYTTNGKYLRKVM